MSPGATALQAWGGVQPVAAHQVGPRVGQILQELDTPVTLRLYFSKDVAQMPPRLSTYAERVQDLLKEYEQNARGNLEVTKLNPTPDSDAEGRLDAQTAQGRTARSVELGRGLPDGAGSHHHSADPVRPQGF